MPLPNPPKQRPTPGPPRRLAPANMFPSPTAMPVSLSPPPLPDDAPKKKDKKTPQEVLADFWDKFHTRHPGKVTSIFPRTLYKNLLPAAHPRGARSTRNAAESYECAARECRESLRRIVQECQRTNEKFTDPDFDVERDPSRNCLNGLVQGLGGCTDSTSEEQQSSVDSYDVKRSLDVLAQSQVVGNAGLTVDPSAMSRYIGGGDFFSFFNLSSGDAYNPGSIHRVDWIFESPQFTVNGYSSSDIKQGANGNCWWLAAIATIAHRKDVMNRVCVGRDEDCGAYGFVFQRDGEWIWTVVDDNLYLREEDFDFYGDVYDATGQKARKHRKSKQTGSEALYFARCEDVNETWLPLLEKAYAKVHGDYDAISGGWPGEAVEDMTGGVSTTVAANRILNKNKLWKELVNSEGNFVFALAAMGTGWDWQRSGLALGHAYSVLQAREECDEDGNKVRLVQIRNPWGERSENGIGEWNGSWSDGSREWTQYWMKKFDHKFGDDGVFWMSYKDMLETFMFLHRTRLFDEKWTIVQQWTSANVSWVTGYLNTKFEIEVKKAGLVVLVLTQLDDRYFKGFEGEYRFGLHFVLQTTDAASGDHICRVRPVHEWENRSVSCEVELEPGKYHVIPKITAVRVPGAKPVQDLVKESANQNPQKLRQIGMQYDLAHAKGGVPDEDEVLEKRKEDTKLKKETKKKQKAKKKARAKARKALRAATDALKKVEELEGKGKDKGKGSAAEKKEEKNDDKKKEEAKAEDGKEKPAEPAAAGTSGLGSSKPETSTLPTEPVRDPAASEAAKADEKTDKPEEKKPEEGQDSKPSEAQPATATAEKGTTTEPAPTNDDAKAGDDVATNAAAVDDNDVGDGLEGSDKDSDSESSSSSEDESEDGDGDVEEKWNAVVVVALRAYARDPDVVVRLVKAEDAEGATALMVDGKPAGATI